MPMQPEARITVVLPPRPPKETSLYEDLNMRLLEVRLGMFGFNVQVSRDGAQPTLLVTSEKEMNGEERQLFAEQIRAFFSGGYPVKNIQFYTLHNTALYHEEALW